eukprot:CAMPEP_0185598428 /NCGR_PEP_ID=MMETSP0434-20130131/81988_1 /TAXON_ID=626734 ORGANISM="Favella taraikaensis, Strain Fe Narragansett Bay" /NCGR_SAMPLE_ID=MMETSP0434 /ASSEMBLY_ACC=CAM_ASM_000379 /LENGTH=45 /DNA_ID= /DNA_START= /DNA_END= /DNA_ORIENTATION=
MLMRHAPGPADAADFAEGEIPARADWEEQHSFVVERLRSDLELME